MKNKNTFNLLKIDFNPVLLKANKYYINEYSTSKKYYMEYNNHLSNHLSHAMIAFIQLNMELNDIKNYFKYYSTKLETPNNYETTNNVSLKPIKCEYKNIGKYIGKRINYYGILNMFKYELENKCEDDIKKLVNKVFPMICNGITGALLHGIIHLGYGMKGHNNEMIIEGLTYITHSSIIFDSNYKPSMLKTNNIKRKTMDIFDVLGTIQKDKILLNAVKDNYKSIKYDSETSVLNPFICLSKCSQNLIQNYLKMFINTVPLLNGKCNISDENKDSDDDVSMISLDKQKYELKKYLLNAMIQVYTYSNGMNDNNFFILHYVTAAWSLGNIIDYLDNYNDINKSVLDYLSSFIAGYIVLNSPDINIGKQEILKDIQKRQNNNNGNDINDDYWKALINELISNTQNDIKNKKFTDEHVYKLIGVIIECVDESIIDMELGYYSIAKMVHNNFNFRKLVI